MKTVSGWIAEIVRTQRRIAEVLKFYRCFTVSMIVRAAACITANPAYEFGFSWYNIYLRTRNVRLFRSAQSRRVAHLLKWINDVIVVTPRQCIDKPLSQ